MLHISRAHVLELWIKLSEGHIDAIDRVPAAGVRLSSTGRLRCSKQGREMKESIAVTNVATGCTFASSRSLVKTNCVLIALLLLPTAAFAINRSRPLAAPQTPFAPVDEAALEFRTSIACDALTVAISKDGKLLYARGFGCATRSTNSPRSPQR